MWRLLAFCSVFVCLCTELPGVQTPVVPEVYDFNREKDYIFPPQGIALQAVPAPSLEIIPIDEGQPVIYHSIWNGAPYSLTEFRGKNVSILLPDSWLTALTLEERRNLLDRNDILYEHYTGLVGEEPGGSGLLRIAIVTESCGYGCGYIGSKGLEVLDSEWSLNIAKAYLAAGKLAPVFPHEMGHNFDVYFSYLAYTWEDAHAWTSFLDNYIHVYSQLGYAYQTPDGSFDDLRDQAPGELLDLRVREQWDPYYRNLSLTWQNTVRDGNPDINLRHATWGGMNLRFAQLHGPAAIRGAMRFWREYKAHNSPPSTTEAKEDLHMEGLAAGVGLNLACYATAWRWQASPELVERMTAAYGTSNPYCSDGDNDGFSPLAGDLDDNQEFVYPGALELKNGVDDNCDRIVDNVVFAEPAGTDFPGHPNATAIPFPGRISGTATSFDDDYYQFTLDSPGRVAFIFNPSPQFQGWLFLMSADRSSWIRWARIWEGNLSAITTFWRYPTAGDWTFSVYEDEPGTFSVPYEVDVFPLAPWPITWGSVSPVEHVAEAYRLRLQVDALPELLEPPTHVRFWVAGMGFVGAVPYAENASFDWTPPAGTSPGTYGYRAQLFAGLTPLTPDTSPEYFTVEVAPTVTFESTAEAIRMYRAAGLIDRPGVAQSLLDQLANAKNALENGDPAECAKILNAMAHHTQAQSGKHIAVDTAQSLLDYIASLRP